MGYLICGEGRANAALAGSEWKGRHAKMGKKIFKIAFRIKSVYLIIYIRLGVCVGLCI